MNLNVARYQSQTVRLLAADRPDFASHQALVGSLPAIGTDQLLSALEASGLAGRGGAGFPAWRKLASARTRPAGTKAPVMIANGAEGEPMSAKDATLLSRSPHLVIDGLLLAARAIGASNVYLYAARPQTGAVARAMAERADANEIVLCEAEDTFISGEASAVVNGIEHGSGTPRDHVARLTASGLGGRPTVVNNVETLAHVALIARFGPQWFGSVGTADEPGTRLFTVSGPDGALRVIELEGGSTIAHALGAAGIEPSEFSAVLVGGYHGGWVPAAAFDSAITAGQLKKWGASPGAGILVPLGIHECGLRVSSGIASYLASQSARQCGPCVNGLPKMAETLARLANCSPDAGLLDEVRRLAGVVSGRGSCHHPDGTARFVLSSVTAFSDDVEAHLSGHCEKG